MQEKLDLQRQQLELQMGFAIGSTITKHPHSTGGSRRNTRTGGQVVKPRGRPATGRQPSNPRVRNQKSHEPPTSCNLEENEPDPSGSVDVLNKGNDEGVNSQSSKVAVMDEEMRLEMEFNQAFEELSDEFSNEALEGLFSEGL